MKFIYSVTVLTMLNLFVACDYYHEEEFFIKNNLDTTATVYYQFGDEHKSVIVPKDTTEMMTASGGPFGSVGVTDNRYNDPLDSIFVAFRHQNTALSDSLWEYKQVTKYHGTYTITLDSLLFD